MCSPPPQSPSDSEVSSESESACTTDSHAESTTDSTDDSGELFCFSNIYEKFEILSSPENKFQGDLL